MVGALVGLIAPSGLAVYGLLQDDRSLDPLRVVVLLALGGAMLLGVLGFVVGRHDDRLRARNRELRALTDRLQALSSTDPLTGIANRRGLDDRLDVELARAHRYHAPLAVVMVDLDLFKTINDQLGHRVGDEVLKRIAELLDREKRIGDLVARYGGEEFVALLPHTDAEAAVMWSERVRAMLPSAAALEGREVTASFGVAEVLLEAADTPEALMERADQALYEAKRRGRNQVVAARPDGKQRAMR